MLLWLLSRGCKYGQTASLGGGRFVTASGEAWFTYSCKALVVMAREVNRCMTALPIILNTKQYTEYLAIRRGPENAITDAGLIETPPKCFIIRRATNSGIKKNRDRDTLWGTLSTHLPKPERTLDHD
jgi:hypothetical protein